MSTVGATNQPARRQIKLLDTHTINQIAAGEVVERPASVVKELVENALDAGATRIEVDLEGYGRDLIAVADNGCGMGREAVESALLRHATSKITRLEDLSSATSLGFRGEALASIASVSCLEMVSGDEDGTRWRVANTEPPSAVSGPRGTKVEVRSLFHNTPARLKFLKTDATELSQCVETVSRYALARPDVRFVVRHEGSALLQTSGAGDLLGALCEVWGRDVARVLVPVDHFNGVARSTGYVSPPHYTRPTRALQWFYVNGRPVRSRLLTAAVDQGYRSLTPERRYPVVILNLDIDPARLDVNVSPTKSEIKFHAEGGVFDAVRRGISEALLGHGMVPNMADVLLATHALEEARGSVEPSRPGGLFSASMEAQAPVGPAPSSTDAPSTIGELLQGLRIHGQVDATFILAENERNLLVIDQHVAHERVLYELLLKTRGAGAIETQRLLAPETVHVGVGGAAALAERVEELAAIGYELEPFGKESFLVRAVPSLYRGKSPVAGLVEMAEELSEGGGHGCLTARRDDVLIMASCKMAVKAGDRLGHAEMERLVRDLAETDNPYLCPHGRPITIVLPKSDLYRRFKR